MAYDQAKLITNVRICLGGISTTKLPDNIITHFGDVYDADPDYTGDFPNIFWRTTLDSVQYLIANATTSSTSEQRATKEKVGNVTKEVSYTDKSDIIDNYNELYDYFYSNPDKFGIILPANSSGVVLINGVNQAEVDAYRNNTNNTSIFNPLPVTAFPKESGCTWRRRVNSNIGNRR
tara:strand:- start:132 stop:662 length:531 start_codon:yes stop_codon:yes gene_type:complete